MALNDLMDSAAFDDLYDNMKDFVAVNGQYYAYPKLVEPSAVMFYRKDMFEAAGLDPNLPPTTWTELLETAQKLTKKGVFGLSIAQTAPDLGWSSWGLQYNAAGHLAVTEDWSKADVNNNGYKALLDFTRKPTSPALCRSRLWPDMRISSLSARARLPSRFAVPGQWTASQHL